MAKIFVGFFHNTIQKNPNEHFAQCNIYTYICIYIHIHAYTYTYILCIYNNITLLIKRTTHLLKSASSLVELITYIHMFVTRLCPALWDLMDCYLPGSSVHGVLQARILEWVVILSSRGSSQYRDQTQVSYIPGRFFTN